MKTGIKYWRVVMLVVAMASSLHTDVFAQTTFKFPSFKNERIQSMDEIWVQVSGKLALCSHSERGSINLTVGGGKPPYTFKWNTNESVQNRTNLNAGTYTVWITDSEGRVHQERIVIQPPFPLVLNPVVKKDATCGSGNDGYAKISVKIGRNDYDPAKPPYQISWSNGLKDVWEANNLAPGTYVVKVADKFNCETSISFEIKSGSAGMTVAESIQNVTCASPTSGRINLSVQGGEAPYTYLWSNGSTSKDLVGVSAGIYQVLVKDSKGCSFQGSYTISTPSSIQLGETLTMPSCGSMSNGQIKLNITGGTAPYSYLWSNGSTQNQLQNLSPGTYSVKVTDASGCSVEKQYALSNLSTLTLASFQKQDVTCFGDNSGKIDLNITGASGTIQAAWSDGSNSINRTNLAPGSYSVILKDQHCEISSSFQILGPSEALSATGSAQNPSCSGNDGKISLNPKGGTSPYTYKWSNGAVTKDLNGLGQGKYTVDITDKNGCSFQASFDLVSPMPITIEETLKDPSCAGNSDGSISLKITGGNTPYTYLWSNGSTQSSIQNLAAGTYKVKITDATGCSVEKEFAVKNLSGLNLTSFQKQDVTCFGINSGKIDLNLSGATGTIQVKWSDGSTAVNRNNLAPGTYSVSIKDLHCEISSTFQITGPQEALSAATIPVNPSCAGNDGKITLTPKGGTAPYTYKWSNGSVSKDLNGLGQGKFTVDITDKNGCSFRTSVDLVSPLPITIEETLKDPSCAGTADGAISLKISGGNTPYTYLWSNGSTQSSLQNLTAGSYKVKISDATGCSVEKEYSVKNQSQLTVAVLKVDPVSCGGGNDGRIVLSVTGGKGTVKVKWEDGFTGLERTNLKSGTYKIQVSDESNCGISSEVKVEEANPLQARIENAIEMDCDLGQLKGRAWVAISGGKAPYAIRWENGDQSGNEILFNQSGVLKVTVKDALGCQTEVEAKVTFPDYNYQGGARLNFEFRKLNFSSEPEVTIEEQIIFESQISPEFISWEWDFGDGNKSQERNPVHVYKTAGTFEVKLTGMDIYGCSLKELSKVVVTQPEEMMVIPNAFSPNGDNLNDCFIPKMKGIKELTLQVFNIWGEKLYAGSGLDIIGWDGTYKGQMVPAGNYIYRIDYVNWEGIKKSASGSISLIR